MESGSILFFRNISYIPEVPSTALTLHPITWLREQR